MSEYRVILALLSVLVGLVLMVLAMRLAFVIPPSPLRRRRVLASVLYGALFLTVGALLWVRKDLPLETAEKPTKIIEQPAPVTKAVPETVVDSLSVQVAEPTADTVVAESAPPAIMPPISASEIVWQAPPQTPEERLYDAFDRWFSAIEAFFYRYGSPVAKTVTTGGGGGNGTRDLSYMFFPYIGFEYGSAAIAQESIGPLKALAVDLQQYPDVRIEIQVRVDGLGPEADNYSLTQARASAVRDLLVVEGVPAERLIARGYGTQPLSVSGDSPVAFVVRR